MSGIDVGIGAVGGIGSLALAVWTLWRIFHRSPDLVARLAAVREYVSKRLRVDKARAARERAVAELAVVRKRLEPAMTLAADRIANEISEMGTAITFGVATVLAFLADSALLVVLNGANALFGLGYVLWAVLGPWVTAGAFVLGHTLAGIAIGDPDRPGLTLRRARIGALVSGIVVAFGYFAALSGRGVDFTKAGWAADSVAFGLWFLTGALALFGSFASIIATTSFNEAKISKRLAELQGLDDAYTRYIESLDAEIEIHFKQPTAADSPASADAPTGATLASPQEGEKDFDKTTPGSAITFNTAKRVFVLALVSSLGITSIAYAQSHAA